MYPNMDNQKPTTPIRNFQIKQGVLSIVKLKKISQNTLVSSSDDQRLRLWKLDHHTGDLQLLKTWKDLHKGPVQKMAIFNNFLYTSSPRDNVLRTFDLQSMEPGHVFEGHTKPLTDVAVDASGKVYTASFDNMIKVWDGKTGAFQSELVGHTDGITCLKVSGNYIISGSADMTLRIWDRRKLNCLHILKGHDSYIFGFRVKDNTIFSYSRDGSVILWKLKTGELKLKIDVGYCIVQTRVFKKFIVTMGTNTLESFNLKGKKVATYEGHSGEILSAKFYDQGYLISGSADRTFRIWNVKKGQQVGLYMGHLGSVNCIVCWEQWIYTAGPDGSIRQWPNPIYNRTTNEEWIF